MVASYTYTLRPSAPSPSLHSQPPSSNPPTSTLPFLHWYLVYAHRFISPPIIFVSFCYRNLICLPLPPPLSLPPSCLSLSSLSHSFLSHSLTHSHTLSPSLSLSLSLLSLSSLSHTYSPSFPLPLPSFLLILSLIFPICFLVFLYVGLVNIFLNLGPCSFKKLQWKRNTQR